MVAALYCGLWILSSSDLAFVACDGKFSLFADSFRCRQPYVALILAIGFLIASSFAIYVRYRVGRSQSRGVSDGA